MAKTNPDTNGLHESSLDNSEDGKYLLIKSDVDSTEPLVNQHFMDPEISNSVTYKLISMPGEDTSANMPNSPTHDTTFYVISNPVEVFGTHGAPSSVKKPYKRETTPSKIVTAKKRDEKRRATHNEVERRRRDKINTWIMKLAALVPDSGVADSASKGGILEKACDHITDLTEKHKRLEKVEVENEKLVLEVFRLTQELSELRKENFSMRNQMADGIAARGSMPNPRLKNQKS